MKRKEAIKQLQEGKIQICNDLLPSTKEIEKLLKKAFPDNNNDFSLLKVNSYITKNTIRKNSFAMSGQRLLKTPIINLSTILKTKRNTLEKTFSKTLAELAELKKDVAEIRQIIAKDVEVNAEEVKSSSVVNLSGWYKDKKQPKWLMYFDYKNQRYYGFDADGCWYYNECEITRVLSSEFPADPKEVEQALIAEAKKRGYKEGNYKCLGTSGITYSHNDNYEYDEKRNFLYTGFDKSGSRNIVFNNGTWAEILEQPKDEIDFSKCQLLISECDGTIVCTNGNHNRYYFDGVVVVDENKKYINHKDCSGWYKLSFKPFKGTLTINQE